MNLNFENVKDPPNILQLFQDNKLVKICAPMVRYSKLQFRNLVKEYGCDMCYTPMILADSFCKSSKARLNEFATNNNDVPVVVQFAANTVPDFVGAAHMVSPYCSGVDLNCGCPQRWAKQMGLGCTLLDKPELLADLVSQCRNRINKPFTVSTKLRIAKDVKKTIDLCRKLEKAGVSYISIHARTSSQITGTINTEALKLAVENVQCPVVSNGGVRNLKECVQLQEDTKCKGVMVANGILVNPTLFSGSETTTLECVKKWLDICYNTTLTMDLFQAAKLETCEITIPERPPNLTFQCFHHHLVFMLEKVLPKYKRRIFNNLQTFKDVLIFLSDEFDIKPQLFEEEVFRKYEVLKLDYVNKDELYYNLLQSTAKPNLDFKSQCGFEYDPDENDGKFFKSRVMCDAESDDYNLNEIFN